MPTWFDYFPGPSFYASLGDVHKDFSKRFSSIDFNGLCEHPPDFISREQDPKKVKKQRIAGQPNRRPSSLPPFFIFPKRKWSFPLLFLLVFPTHFSLFGQLPQRVIFLRIDGESVRLSVCLSVHLFVCITTSLSLPTCHFRALNGWTDRWVGGPMDR